MLQYLPSAALSQGLHTVLQSGGGLPVRNLVTLVRLGGGGAARRGEVVQVGMTADLGSRSPAASPAPPSRGPAWLRSPDLLRRLALASVVANVVIVVTGGAVRLTNSGLGCPTWPRCTDNSLVPTAKLQIHGAIEFTNRTLTFVLAAVAIATWLVAMRAS